MAFLTLVSTGGFMFSPSQTKDRKASSEARPERRRVSRAKIGLTVRVRPSNVSHSLFEEVRTTWDVSRQGLYFTTQRLSYRVGMNVTVACPYSQTPGTVGDDGELGRVVRIDRLSGGYFGIAVVLLRFEAAGPNALTRPYAR
jgi:hypothetical protein